MEAAQEILEKVQQEYQGLRAEKEQLLGRIGELELQKDTLEESKRQSQGQNAELKEKITSLTAALEEAKEQQVCLQPFKQHILAQRNKMHQLQVAIEEERCKVLQVDNWLEDILETSSYFVDRLQYILEVPTGRMARLEANEETPADLPSKDHKALRQYYDLLEFSTNTAEEFKKVVKKTRGACAELFRRLLITYNHCQVEAEQRMDTFPYHRMLFGYFAKKISRR